jgi:hypothetical protein
MFREDVVSQESDVVVIGAGAGGGTLANTAGTFHPIRGTTASLKT